MKKTFNILFICIFCCSIYGEDSDPFFAQKGYALKRDGWIFSSDKTKEMRDRLIDLDAALQTNQSLNKSLSIEQDMNKLQEDKINILLQQNNNLVKSIDDTRGTSDLAKILWFSLGVVATGLAVYGAKALTK